MIGKIEIYLRQTVHVFFCIIISAILLLLQAEKLFQGLCMELLLSLMLHL